ncbi:MAG TPA: purine-nucleoside phosphorylase [Chthoniobacterales bacterium]|nr:purine-nucleoside phosphorylase [Chthoniobacterales bacterium]
MTDARERLAGWGADTAIVLGSGLGALTDAISVEQRIAYSAFPEIPAPRVAGHAGQFALGSVAGTKVIFAQGRVHLYEGHTARDVTAGIRTLADCGIKRLILTNAAGTANPAFAPGSCMMISDHLNLTGTTPLLGAPAFIDMADAYSREWRTRFASAAERIGINLHEGVYAGVLGPQYETPAEVQMLRQLGADAIGMSTVLETIQARALRLTVAGFSCLTNWAAGMADEHLSHEGVLTTGKSAAAEFARLLTAALQPA